MKNLFIGNLSFQVTEGELRALLEPFGQVGRVHMPRNRETGQMRGFAFVEMANVSAPHFLAVESANGLFRLIV